MQNASAQQGKSGAAIHLTLNQFEPVDMTLDRTITPVEGQSGEYSGQILLQSM